MPNKRIVISDCAKKYFYPAFFIIFFVIIWVLFPIIKPFLGGFIIAFMLNPGVKLLEKVKIPRYASAALLMLLIFMLLIAVIIPITAKAVTELLEFKNFLSSDRIMDFYVSLPNRIKSLYAYFSVPKTLDNYLDSFLKDPKWLQQAGVKSLTVIRAGLGVATQRMGSFLVMISSSMFTIVLMPIIAYYILLQYDKATEAVFSLIPARFRADTKFIFKQVQEIFSSFFRGQMTVCAVIAILMSIGLGVIGLPYAIIIGILAGAANIVPYLGAIVGILLSLVTAFLSFPAEIFFVKVIYIVIVYSIIQLLDNLLLSPKIIGDSVNLHPLVIMFVLMAGAFVADFSGLIFAVPIAATAKTLWAVYGPDLDKL